MAIRGRFEPVVKAKLRTNWPIAVACITVFGHSAFLFPQPCGEICHKGRVVSANLKFDDMLR